MIVSPRGTSGSGKTTLARLVLDGEGIFGPRIPHYVPKRKNPLYYTREYLDPVRPWRGIAILGSYESATGGVDTISSNQMPFDLMRELAPQGYHVFCEGLLHSAEQHRTAAMHKEGHDVRLFYFQLPLEECLQGVRDRRAARGNFSPLNPDTTAARHRTLRLHPPRFRALGINVVEGDRRTGVQWLVDIGLASKVDVSVRGLLFESSIA